MVNLPMGLSVAKEVQCLDNVVRTQHIHPLFFRLLVFAAGRTASVLWSATGVLAAMSPSIAVMGGIIRGPPSRTGAGACSH